MNTAENRNEKAHFPSDNYVRHITTFLYYTHKMAVRPSEIVFKNWHFLIPPGVFRASILQSLPLYEKTFGSLQIKDGFRALDMGCGSGVISVLLATLGWNVLAVDLSQKAIEATLHNAHSNKVSVNTEIGNMFSAMGMEDKFELIAFNIPYFKADNAQDLTEIENSWFWTEQDLINFFAESKARLQSPGHIVIFTSSCADFHPQVLAEYAGNAGLRLREQITLPNRWLLPAVKNWKEVMVEEFLIGCIFSE